MLKFWVYRDSSSGPEEKSVAVLLNAATEWVDLTFSVPTDDRLGRGIYRSVEIFSDGTVKVRDTPQATGMTAEDVSFVAPGNKGEATILPPYIRRTRFGRIFWTPRPKFKRERY